VQAKLQCAGKEELTRLLEIHARCEQRAVISEESIKAIKTERLAAISSGDVMTPGALIAEGVLTSPMACAEEGGFCSPVFRPAI
jgi:hypothetical protein